MFVDLHFYQEDIRKIVVSLIISCITILRQLFRSFEFFSTGMNSKSFSWLLLMGLTIQFSPRHFLQYQLTENKIVAPPWKAHIAVRCYMLTPKGNAKNT